MAIAVTQQTAAEVGSVTSTTVQLATVTVGYLLVSVLVVDKSAGSVPAPSAGWTAINAGVNTAAVSGAMAWRTADGTAADACTWTWSTAPASPSAVAMVEVSMTSTALANSAQTVITAAGTSIGPVDPGAATAVGCAVFGFGIDSAPNLGVGFPTFSDTAYTVPVRYGDDEGASAGRTGLAVAFKVLANTTATSTSASWTTGDEAWLTGARFTGTDPGTAPATAAVNRWLGNAGPTALTLTTKTAAGAVVTPRWSVNADMTSAVTGTAVTADAEGWAKHAVGGLTASTLYYYIVAVDGVDSTKVSFRTFPAVGTAANFSFTYASCLNEGVNANPQSLLRMRDRAPTFVLFQGDLNYFDTNTTDAALYRGMHAETIGRGNFEAVASSRPVAYTWSDHDTCGDSTDSTFTGLPAVSSAYRTCVPHYPLQVRPGNATPADTRGIYYTFVIGRVRFIVWDGRNYRSPKGNTDDVNKTLLGGTQKQWTKDLIAETTEPFVFIVSEVVWAGDSGVQDDHWGSYRTEQGELVTWLNANVPATRRVHFLSGDGHMLAIDDGSNGDGYASWNAAPIAQVSSNKGGLWSHGFSTVANQMYGLVTVTDDGTNITAKYEGRRADDDTIAAANDTGVPMTHTVASGTKPPQKARPASDVAVVGWSTAPSGEVFSVIDEGTASDADYAHTTVS